MDEQEEKKPFAEGDMLNFADSNCALQVRLIKYYTFNVKEDGRERKYEGFVMGIEKILEDKQDIYQIGHRLTRERPIGEESSEWSLNRVVSLG